MPLEKKNPYKPPYSNISMEDDSHQRMKLNPNNSETIFDSEGNNGNNIDLGKVIKGNVPTVKRNNAPQLNIDTVKIAQPNMVEKEKVNTVSSEDYEAFLKWRNATKDKIEMNHIEENINEDGTVRIEEQIISSNSEDEFIESDDPIESTDGMGFMDDPNLSEDDNEIIQSDDDVIESTDSIPEELTIDDMANPKNDKRIMDSLNDFDEGLRLKFNEDKYTDLDEYRANKREKKEAVAPVESTQSFFDELMRSSSNSNDEDEIISSDDDNIQTEVSPDNDQSIISEKEEIPEPEFNTDYLHSDDDEDRNNPSSDDEPAIAGTILEKEFDFGDDNEGLEIGAAEVDLTRFIKDKRFALNSDELASIKVKKGGRFGDYKAIRNAMPKRPASTIVLPQSGYWCEVSAITNRELQIIQDSTNSFYESMDKIYRILYGKIEKMPGGKLGYEKWLKITSFFDYSSFLYGIYCQTFPFKNKYELTCNNPSCRHRFEAEVPHASLMDIPGDKEAYQRRVDSILTEVKQLEDIPKHSLLTKTKRIQLPESNIVVDFRLPSLYQYLNESAKLIGDENLSKRYSLDSLMSLCFIEGMFMPDPYEYENTGHIEFIPVVDKTDQLFEINKFSVFDGITYADELVSFTDQYRTRYSIRGVRCPRCKTELDSGELEILNLIFLAISNVEEALRKQRQRKGNSTKKS